jgi:hypothetical protein
MSPNSGLATIETPVTPSKSPATTPGSYLGHLPSLAIMPVSPSASPSSTLRLSPSSSAKHQSTTSEEPPSDPTKCEVTPGKETTVEINKDKMGLGLSIVGGSDTLLVSADRGTVTWLPQRAPDTSRADIVRVAGSDNNT